MQGVVISKVQISNLPSMIYLLTGAAVKRCSPKAFSAAQGRQVYSRASMIAVCATFHPSASRERTRWKCVRRRDRPSIVDGPRFPSVNKCSTATVSPKSRIEISSIFSASVLETPGPKAGNKRVSKNSAKDGASVNIRAYALIHSVSSTCRAMKALVSSSLQASLYCWRNSSSSSRALDPGAMSISRYSGIWRLSCACRSGARAGRDIAKATRTIICFMLENLSRFRLVLPRLSGRCP